MYARRKPGISIDCVHDSRVVELELELELELEPEELELESESDSVRRKPRNS